MTILRAFAAAKNGKRGFAIIPVADPQDPASVPIACGVFQREKAARRAAFVYSSHLFLDAVSGVSRCILHITCDIVSGTFGLIHLALGFHFLVTGELPGPLVDGSLGFVSPSHVRDP
jgi:hypothetical protein